MKENLCVNNEKSKYSWDKWICRGYDWWTKEDAQWKCDYFVESHFLKETCMYEEIRSEYHGCKCLASIIDRMADMKLEEI